jgi:hypothetical protein
MRILYGKGFGEDDRRNFKPVIYSNVLLSMRTLITQADELGFTVDATVSTHRALWTTTLEIMIVDGSQDAKELISDLKDDAPIDEKVPLIASPLRLSKLYYAQAGKAIAALWKDQGILQAYGQRARFQLNDTAN